MCCEAPWPATVQRLNSALRTVGMPTRGLLIAFRSGTAGMLSLPDRISHFASTMKASICNPALYELTSTGDVLEEGLGVDVK